MTIPDRLWELAEQAALNTHVTKDHEGHSNRPFEQCEHRDCALVRSRAGRETPPPADFMELLAAAKEAAHRMLLNYPQITAVERRDTERRLSAAIAAVDAEAGGGAPPETPRPGLMGQLLGGLASLAEQVKGETPAAPADPDKAERVFQAVVYAYEGKAVPDDLREHGMVKRALRYRAAARAEARGSETKC